MLKDKLNSIINEIPGKVGFYYKDLTDGLEIGYGENELFIAASVIKVPILIEVLRQIESGKINDHDIIRVEKEDKMPSCGALTYMRDGLEVSIKDLYTLMIIHSDNTATNILINLAGMDNINRTLSQLGCKDTKLNRLLFDSLEQEKGKENYISPYEMGYLLEKMYKKELLSKSISQEAQRVLKLQRLDSKIPYLLPNHIEIGHKTGEDSGITHDVGIIYSTKPFIYCFTSNETHVISAENALRQMALICYEDSLNI